MWFFSKTAQPQALDLYPCLPTVFPPSRWVRLIRGLDDSHVESCDDDVIRRRCSLQLTGPCLGNEPQLTMCGWMWTQRTIDTLSLLSLLQSLRTAYSYSQNHACMHALNEMKPPLLLSHHPSLDPISFSLADLASFTLILIPLLLLQHSPANTARRKEKKKTSSHRDYDCAFEARALGSDTVEIIVLQIDMKS